MSEPNSPHPDSPAPGAASAVPSFTGRRRERKTRRSVLYADWTARSLITVGGIGTIFAVLGVFVFLVWVVVPLFLPAAVTHLDSFATPGHERVLHLAVDEYQVMGWVLLPSGKLEAFRLDNGEQRLARQLFEPGVLNSASFLIGNDLAAFGLTDGTVHLAQIGFDTEIVGVDQLPAQLATALDSGERGAVLDHEDGVVQLTSQGQYRIQKMLLEPGRETRVSDGPVRLVSHVIGPDGPLIAALASTGGAPRLFLIAGHERSDFLTGGTSLEFEAPVELPIEIGAEEPAFLAFAGAGDTIYVAWKNGRLLRIDCSDRANSYVAERGTLVPAGRTLTSLSFIIGSNTLVWGDSAGNVEAGFLVASAGFDGESLGEVERDPRTNKVFALAKSLARGSEEEDAAALALGPSSRSRLLLAGFADGRIALYNVTHASPLTSFQLPVEEPILQVVMSPKEEGLAVATPSRVYFADLDTRHPEASFTAFFRSVWYEGYGERQHTWQSSSGTDDFEMKLGLMPLIFGTVKATVYSMLFGAPLALLAAIFTSEFLRPRTKAVIKPAIELMASLPSVVLGFLAALVFAPYVEKVVPAVLVSFFSVPLAFLLGAFLWQLLPVDVAIRYERWRFGAMALTAPLGILLASVLGPLVERWLFAGDLMEWLAWDGSAAGAEPSPYASAVGGWTLLTLPLCALVTALALGRFVNPLMRARGAQWDRRQFALVDLAKFAAALAVILVSTLALAYLLDAFGLDPRGGFIDTYVQRNALIVGFVMGFAIIPIIYTISEDALTTVPEHLRSASLGAGATPWQTAVRIVIPTAMSGLFSALMIGLGRAVGETMIVLMAAGNTPVMSWSIFEGFRTLSANIAVELPEAVRNSTHYRTLFLAALVLFALTFVVNTVAEVIRQRFRKRAYQL